MSKELDKMVEKCLECGGETVLFSGKGLNTQYKICTQYKEVGHKSETEINEILSNIRRQIRPSGRFA